MCNTNVTDYYIGDLRNNITECNKDCVGGKYASLMS